MSLVAITGPDGTIAPADDRLYAPHALGGVWLAVGIVAVVAAIALAVWLMRPRHARLAAVEPPATVHDRYLRRIDELGTRAADGFLDERHLHHELARTLRAYAGDTGTTGADAMSAGALDEAGRRGAAGAVRSFEHPQFAESPSADIEGSLRRARAVVSDDRGSVTDDRGPVTDGSVTDDRGSVTDDRGSVTDDRGPVTDDAGGRP